MLYSGTLGQIEDNGLNFTGELSSAKQVLEQDFVPRTSPTCRANFCGKGCGLSAIAVTSRVTLAAIDFELNRVQFAGLQPDDFVDGQLRFLDGPQTGIPFGILDSAGSWLVLDRPLIEGIDVGVPAELRMGCDHTLGTYASRFDNAVNFRGEPFLPGNDLLARYGQGGS